MIKIKLIKASDGSFVELEDEFIDLRIVTSVREQVPLSLSLPTLSGSVALEMASAAAITGYQAGDIVEVFDTESGGLTLSMRITEISSLPLQSRVEISCSGNFLEESVKGFMNIKGRPWSKMQEDFKLYAVQHYESVPQFTATIRTGEDLVMAIAWIYQSRRTVSPTPFTTNDNLFKGSGYGIFREKRYGESHDYYSPVYRITEENIIDYNISPAQPIITQLTPKTPPKQAPKPSVPVINIDEAWTDVKTTAFYIEETGVAAIYYSYTDNAGSKMRIRWSDGLDTEVLGGPVIGITSSGYLVYVAATTTVQYRSKQAGALYSSKQITEPISTDRSIIVKEHVVNTTSAGPKTIIFFDNITPALTPYHRAVLGVYVGEDYVIQPMYTDSADIIASYNGQTAIRFVDTCRIVGTAGEVAVSALFYKNYGTSQRRTILLQYVHNGVNHSNTFLGDYLPNYYASKVEFTPTAFVTGVANPSAGDVYVFGSTFYSEAPFPPGPMKQSVDVNALKCLPGAVLDNRSAYMPSGSHDSVKKVMIEDKVFESLEDIYLITYSSGLLSPETSEMWTLYRIRSSDGDLETYQVTRGSLGEWNSEYIAYSQYRNYLFASSALFVYAEGKVILQLGNLAVTDRAGQRELPSQKLYEGEVNSLTVGYKIGPFETAQLADLPINKGRIEITLAGFEVGVNEYEYEEWLEFSVQRLNMMAIGAYCRCFIGGEYLDIRVLSFSLSYGGVVTAKMVGMIV